MNKINYVLVYEKFGKHYAMAIQNSTSNNQLSFLDSLRHDSFKGELKIVQVCKSGIEALKLAESWNESYKANGTMLDMVNEAILEILGVEENNYKERQDYYDNVVKDYKALRQELLDKHFKGFKIYFRQDYGIYCSGEIIGEKNDLVAISGETFIQRG